MTWVRAPAADEGMASEGIEGGPLVAAAGVRLDGGTAGGVSSQATSSATAKKTNSGHVKRNRTLSA
jgi:hypothetical protein